MRLLLICTTLFSEINCNWAYFYANNSFHFIAEIFVTFPPPFIMDVIIYLWGFFLSKIVLNNYFYSVLQIIEGMITSVMIHISFLGSLSKVHYGKGHMMLIVLLLVEANYELMSDKVVTWYRFCTQENSKGWKM